MARIIQNILIYLYELNSTDGLNNRTLDGILRSSLEENKTQGATLNTDLKIFLKQLNHWCFQVKLMLFAESLRILKERASYDF